MPDCPIASRRERRRAPGLPSSTSSAASSLSREVSRSASRRELENTIVDRCSRTSSSSRRSTAGQIDGPLRGARRRADHLLVGAARGGPLVERGQVGHRHLDGDLDRLRRSAAAPPRPAGPRPGTWTPRRPGARWPRARSAGRACVEQLVEPLQRQRQVRAALGAGHRVHLVEDHRLHAAQRLPRRRGEHQEQRLRRGDQHVGRGAGEQPALVGRGVAGAHARP